jgi:hypothetical protein
MANVTFTPNHQPAPACYPSDVNGLLDMLTTGGGMSGTIPDTAGGGIYVGSSPPSSALTNKVWFKTDGAGRPLGIFMFYNGNWRKVYTGVALGTITMCWYYEGFFDGTGRGILGGDYDGWAICNGANGTPNFLSRFPIGGVQGESVSGGAANAWYTDIDGQAWRNNGGSKGPEYITRTKLPKLTSFVYGNLLAAPGSGAYAVANAGQTVVGDWPLVDGAGNPIDGAGQQPMNIPQFQALGFLMFVGYQ